MPNSELRPEIQTNCTVCGSAQQYLLASAAELEAQRSYLRRFHRLRIRAAAGNDKEALEERAEFTQAYATTIVACVDCQLIFRNPRPTIAAIEQAYTNDHYGVDRLEALFESQLEVFRHKAGALRPWLAGTSQPWLVELGSFVGAFLRAAQEQGWRVLGIDPGKEVAGFCAAKGLPVLQSRLEECRLPSGAVDCVAIWNTFDQIPAPRQVLKRVHALLRPRGIIAVRVPNGACYTRAVRWLRRWPLPLRSGLQGAMAWNNLLAFPYLHGYSVVSLDRLLRECGFARLAYRPDVLVPLADRHTRRWAVLEERLAKTVWRLASALDVMPGLRGARIAPWFDAYYQRIEDTPSGSL